MCIRDSTSYADTDGVITDPTTDLDNEFGDTSEVAYREVTPEIGVAKEIVGVPVPQADGTFAVTYEVVVENTGLTDLVNLSVVEDLASQFGAAFSSAGNLTLITGTTDPNSSVSLNSTGWDGGAVVSEIIDPAGTGSNLAIGDSFTFRFDVVVNPTSSALDNQVKASGTAVDHDGNPILDGAGMPVMVMDLSDSGTDPDDPNAGAPGDDGMGGTR